MNECEIRLLNSDGTYASIAAQFQTSDVLAFGPDIDWRTSSVLKSGERDSRYIRHRNKSLTRSSSEDR